MMTLMRNGRDRRSENPRSATRGKNACLWLGPISGSHQGPQPERLHLEAGYMAAPVSFRERSDSFPLHRGRRPYMARSVSAALSRLLLLPEVKRPALLRCGNGMTRSGHRGVKLAVLHNQLVQRCGKEGSAP